MCGPRSLRIRMWIGFCPPSKFTLRRAPEREPAPLWPRPEVLPVPAPSPRPMRLRGLREPGAGLRLWRPMRSSGIAHLHQVADRVDQPAHGVLVGTLGGPADAAEAEGAQRVALPLARAVCRAHLRDHELPGHQAGDSSATGCEAEPPSSPTGSRPSTCLTVRPRSSATWSGLRSVSSALTVALTRLIGFWLPSDFDSTSWIPASSSTARTPPPAITPVPGEAGFSSTRDAPCTPITSCVIVEPCIGTLKRPLRARSTPFWIATGTSFALP